LIYSHSPYSPEKLSPIVGQSHVYILPTQDQTQLKIGRSIDPVVRIAGLANIYPSIDLSRSLIIGVDSHRIENVLHTVFSLRRKALETRTDGYTEWFTGDFVEEALTFTQLIAQHRGVAYTVFGNVDRLLQECRARNPLVGQRAPQLTPDERKVRTQLAKILLREAILDHTQRFIDVLYEYDVDAIVHHEGNAYLARTVHREQEPEGWQCEGSRPYTDRGRHLARQAQISVQAEGSSCMFHLLQPPIFVPCDADIGREYFRISEPRPGSLALPANDLFLTEIAFAELWSAIEHLPVLEALQNSAEPNDGMQSAAR